jgi:hypothetical protein
MTEEQAIRNRLFSCIDLCGETLKEVAQATGTNYSYLSALRSRDNPEIKASLIGSFCKKYGFSPAHIILGFGPQKAEKQKSNTQLDRIEDTLDRIITSLIDGMLSSSHTNQMTDLQKLIKEAKGRKN